MKLMGLSAGAHWMSWFLTVFLYIVVVMAVYTILCGLDITQNGPVLTKTDPSLFFVFLLCYGLSVISFCFMISVFTQRGNYVEGSVALSTVETRCRAVQWFAS